MDENGKTKLRSLLFGGEKGTLVNVKLFPGTGRELSADSLGAAAEQTLKNSMDAWETGVDSNPPRTGLAKRPLLG